MFLALREIQHSKLRFALIGVVMVLISLLVFMLSGLASGLANNNGAALNNMNAEYMVFETDSRSFLHRSVLPMDKVNEIKQQDGIKDAAPFGELTATILKKGSDDKIDAAIIGIDANSFLLPAVVEGEQLINDTPDRVIVDEKLKRDGLEIGDTIRLQSSDKEMKIVGFTTNELYTHMPVVFTTIPQWQALKFTGPPTKDDVVNPINAIAVQAETNIMKQLDTNVSGIETVTKNKALLSLPGYKEQNRTFMLMIGALLVISAVVLGVFFYVLTLQKSNQFGVLKALGAKTSYLAKSVMSQVFIISFIGISAGGLLTFLLALGIPDVAPFAFDVKIILLYGVLLLAVSLLGAGLSIRRIAKIDPLQAMGRVE